MVDTPLPLLPLPLPLPLVLEGGRPLDLGMLTLTESVLLLVTIASLGLSGAPRVEPLPLPRPLEPLLLPLL